MRNESPKSSSVRPGHGPSALGMPVEKAKNFRGTLKRLAGYLAPQRYRFFAVFFFAIISTVFSILGPMLLGKGTTLIASGLSTSIDFNAIANMLLILLCLYAVSAASSYAMSYLMASVSQKTVCKMRTEVKDKLDSLPLTYFDGRTHGEILSRVTNDMDTIANTLQQSLTQLITSIVSLIGILMMMILISPTLTVIALVSLPVCGFLTVRIAKRSQKYFGIQQKSLGALNGHVEEMFTGHRIVKAFGGEARSIEAFEKVNEELYHAGKSAQFMSGIIMPVLNFINNLGYVLICIIGGVLVAKRAIEIGDIQAFIQYMRQFTQPIVQTANIANVIQGTIAGAERVFEILDEPEQIPDQGNDNLREHSDVRGEIVIEHLDFQYSPDVPLIRDMNLQVLPGQTVAIVGPTGAGKTTLVNLLLRFYELDGGRILIDGIDSTAMSREQLRSHFGMVLQDTWLFKGSILSNIGYGLQNATSEQIKSAAKAAHADHFIRSLPQGYETEINEEATNLSQGQKQLLTIARALLADPPILILDEATSNVDTRTEVLIQQAMSVLMEGRTSFVIAHRLSTIKNADLILVMKDGAVIEQGTHTELMNLGGFYAELYNSQFRAESA